MVERIDENQKPNFKFRMHSEKSDIRLDIRLTMIEDGSPVILLIFKVAENGL